MAPLPGSSSLKSYLDAFLLKRTPAPTPASSPSSAKFAELAARTENLVRRTVNPGVGVTPPSSIPNKVIFALFGLIGVGIVCTGIWFFFWAKNGGFYFKETDWDDYKSTVLRRKGPNGTTLSGATESTDLGGGSVVHGENDEKKSLWGRRKKGGRRNKESRYKDFDEESTGMTGTALDAETVVTETKSRWKIGRKGRKNKNQGRLRGGDLASEMTENTGMIAEEEVLPSVEDAMRAYRHEKPARVGGLNKESDGSAWDGSTNDNSTAASDLLSHRETTPTNTPTKIKKQRNDTLTGGTGGIRKVVSTNAGAGEGSSFWRRVSGGTKAADEDDRIKTEARKLQEKGRAAQRRDFSFQAGDDSTVDGSLAEERRIRREEREQRRASRSPTKKVPGNYYAESDIGSTVSSDVGTKSYHHPIPGLSSTGASDYAEERRKKRAGGGGYRRGRRDSLSDDGH